MGWHQRWWGKWKWWANNKETDTDESEDEEEIMTLTPIGPPIKSKWELQRLDIGQKIMPGCTRQQTREAIQLVEENLDYLYQDCALMPAKVTGW